MGWSGRLEVPDSPKMQGLRVPRVDPPGSRNNRYQGELTYLTITHYVTHFTRRWILSIKSARLSHQKSLTTPSNQQVNFGKLKTVICTGENVKHTRARFRK
jgi:hypothetical protein